MDFAMMESRRFPVRSKRMPSHRKLSSDLHRGKPLFIRLRAEESRRLSALARAYRVTKVEFLRRLLATTRDPEGVEQFVAVCRLCRRVSWPAMAETCPTCVQPTLEGQRICCRAVTCSSLPM